MGKFKQFKTFVRKKLGMTGVAEFVDDAVAANTDKNWNNWFSNPKYLKQYADEGRLKSYDEVISIFEKSGAFADRNTMFDAGCGTGHLLAAMARRFSDIKLYGADFSDEGLAVSKKTAPSAEFFHLDLYNLPDGYQQYDIVLCSEVLEHLLYPDTALENLKKLVAPKGVLLLTVPNGRIDRYGGHINFWSPESWKVFVEKYCSSFGEISTGVFHNNLNNFAIISKL